MTRPAVFLDRDGTLVEEVPYLHDPERLALLPGVGELAALAAAGYALVVVTNQAGVARGLYDEAAVAAVHRRLRRLLAGAGVRLDAVLYCPHHPEGTVAAYARTCRDRKPGPGMLEAAARRLGLDLAASFLIGNAPADVGAAAAAGRGRLRRAGRRGRRGAGGRGARGQRRGQTRSGRDGAGLARDAGWSRASAPLTGTSSGRVGPPRDPPISPILPLCS
jgi:D-glycero-D-manno-heptose 1,7-bisphosphate phosphatase